MLTTRWLWFAAGVAVGAVAGRTLLGQPEVRRTVKRVLKSGLALKDWVVRQVETLREDMSDLVAEAREERAGGPPAAPDAEQGA